MATKKMYSLYLCLDGLISKRVLCQPFKNVSLENIDQSLTHFSDVYDFLSKSKFDFNDDRKYSLVIMSSNGNKFDVLFSQDRDFYEKQFQERSRIDYNNDLLDVLYKYLFNSSDNKRIEESPIYNQFRSVLKSYVGANGKIDFVHLSYSTLNWGFGSVRRSAINNYRFIREIYLYLKEKGLIKEVVSDLKSENEVGQVNEDAEYYLYIKNKIVNYDSNNFFKDKVLVYSGTLKDIDKYTFTHSEVVDGMVISNFERNKLIELGGDSYIKAGLDVLLNSSDNQTFYDSEILENKDSKDELYYWLNLYFPLASTKDSFISFFDKFFYSKMVNTSGNFDRKYLINEWWGNIDFEKLSYKEIRAIYFAIKRAVMEENKPLNKGDKKRKRV